MKATSYDRFVLLTGLMPDVLARNLLTEKQVIEGIQLSKEDHRFFVEYVDKRLRWLHANNATFRHKLRDTEWAEEWVSQWFESFLQDKIDYEKSFSMMA